MYAELAAAINGLTDSERASLTQSGVRCPLIGAANIISDGRTFQPYPDGDRAYIFAVLDRSHVCTHTHGNIEPLDLVGNAAALVDLAAWDGTSLTLRHGNIAALGEYGLRPLNDESDPLLLWSTPVAWAAAGHGAVIIDWPACAYELAMWRSVVCDTVALGERLEAALKAYRAAVVPRMPRIRVKEQVA